MAALAVLKDGRLATACHDRQLRTWCLRSFKLLHAVPDAHDTPLQVHTCRCLILKRWYWLAAHACTHLHRSHVPVAVRARASWQTRPG